MADSNLDPSKGKLPRTVDHSGRDARLAIANVVAMLGPLRSRAAMIYARTQRPLTEEERMSMEAECKDMATVLRNARVELLDQLVDAPRKVVRHSRVVDAEKAIDNLDDSIAKCLELLRAE